MKNNENLWKIMKINEDNITHLSYAHFAKRVSVKGWSIAPDKGVLGKYFSYFPMKTYVVGTH